MIWKGTQMSAQKPSHEVEGIFRRAPSQDCIDAQMHWEGYQKLSAALKVPKNTVASIILKCKKFETAKTLPRDGHQAKLSNQGKRALVREVTKNQMVTLTKLQFLCGDGKPVQKDNHLWGTPPIKPL